MYVLIGDIGNTVTKICLIENRSFKVKKIVYFSSHKILLKNFLYRNLKKIIKKKPINKFALFSSVVPKYHKILKKLLKKNYKIQLKEIKENGINKIIKINIKNKKQVGSDRIANAIGVINNNKNYIVIDFGTATTFDVIIDKTYLGGVIAPGVKLSLENLSNKASLIPKIKLSKILNVIGTNTSEAVKSGFFWGYLGLIDNIIKLIKKQSRKQFKIVLTGGLSHLFKNTIKGKSVIEKDLTITGLKKVIITLIK